MSSPLDTHTHTHTYIPPKPKRGLNARSVFSLSVRDLQGLKHHYHVLEVSLVKRPSKIMFFLLCKKGQRAQLLSHNGSRAVYRHLTYKLEALAVTHSVEKAKGIIKNDMRKLRERKEPPSVTITSVIPPLLD